jgi:hypothetical protein
MSARKHQRTLLASGVALALVGNIACSNHPRGPVIQGDGGNPSMPGPHVDLAAPPAVSPAIGMKGTVFSVNLQVTEALAEAPLVTLQGPPAAPIPCVAGGALQYACAYTATGDENSGLGGAVPFDVALTAAEGATATKLAAGVIVLDFTPPALVKTSVLPAMVIPGDTIAGTFTVDQFVAGDLLVQFSVPLGGATQIQATQDTGTLNYHFAYTVTAADPVGEVAFSVSLVNSVGDRTDNVLIGSTVIGRPPAP